MLYKIIYTNAPEPNLKDVNEEAEKGWQLIQMGHSPTAGTEKLWYYVLAIESPPEPIP